MAKRILFFLKEYDNYSLIFSEYLAIFNKNGFETQVFNFTKKYAPRSKLAYIISVIKEIKKFHPDMVYIGDELFSKNVFLIVLLKKLFFFKYKVSALIASQYIPRGTSLNNAKVRFLLNNVNTLFCRNEEEFKKIKMIDAFKNYQGLTRLYLGVPEKFFPKIEHRRQEILAHLPMVKEGRVNLDGKYVLGFAGRIVPEKGLRFLLECLKELPSNFVLLLARRTDEFHLDYVSQIDNFIADNNLTKRVMWTENLDNNDIKYLYNVCDLMVMPTTAKYDGFSELFGSVIAESMLCRTLIIGSDNGSIPEVIDNPRFIFKQNDARDMVRVINFVYGLSSEEKQRVLENNYKKALQDYSDKAFVNTIIKVY